MMKSTYRLQISKTFTFNDAAALVPTLYKPLGVSHLYVSPALESVADSNHGYDVTNPHCISVERGGMEGYLALAATGLDILQDIVPNHEFLGSQNLRWVDEQTRRALFDLLPDGSVRKFFYFDLAGLRIDEPAVFDDTHKLIVELAKAGVIKGIRLDYINGLKDPVGYLTRLREATGLDTIWVERILGRTDKLTWKVKGTVGYEFLRAAQEVMTDPAGEQPLAELYSEVTGEKRTFLQVVHAARPEVVKANYAHEVGQLVNLMPSLTREQVEAALVALEPRTFIVPGTDVSNEDRAAILSCTGLARNIRAMLLLESPADPQFVVLLQQVADFVGGTAYLKTYYRHNQLIARNEMGIDAAVWSIGIEQFHAFNLAQLTSYPETMNSLETHDTFLSRDARARIVALSHIPEQWRKRVLEWRNMNAKYRAGTNGEAPDANTEYRLYQALLASWPISFERFMFYVEKSNREAGSGTNWINPNREWEARVEQFVRSLYNDAMFIGALEGFLAEVVNPLGDFIAVAQQLLQITVPGVPDIYYGNEMRRLSLVDPDQRRAVDWDASIAMLADLQAGKDTGVDGWRMEVIRQGLALRERHAADFLSNYQPVDRGVNVIAFQRGDNVMVEVPVRKGIAKQGAPEGWRDLLPTMPFGLYERI